LRISDIDDFCRERANTLLRSLCGSSLAIQQVVLPLLACQLHKYQKLANSVMSNIPSLVYSRSATSSSIAAYAVTVSIFAKMVHKRTYMDFAFSSIRSVLLANVRRNFVPQTKAVLITALSDMVAAFYSSPEIGKISKSG
jgi:hypothetical protein